MGLVCELLNISKKYIQGNREKYFFILRNLRREFLSILRETRNAYFRSRFVEQYLLKIRTLLVIRVSVRILFLPRIKKLL